MAKKKSNVQLPPKRLRHRIRKLSPIIERDGDQVVLMCPFCPSPHMISTEVPAQCGTQLEVMAKQTVYSQKSNVCALCGEKGGDMVKIGERFRHVDNCSPGQMLFAEPPTVSFWAKIVYHMPTGFQNWLFDRTEHSAIALSSKDEDGEITVKGYSWQKMSR